MSMESEPPHNIHKAEANINMSRVVAIFVFALIFAIASSALAEELEKRLSEEMLKCKTEVNVTEGEIKGMLHEGFLTDGSKCYAKCVIENMDMFLNGAPVESKIMKMIEDFSKNKHEVVRERLILLFNKCKAITGECPCDTAGKIYICCRDVAAKDEMMRKSANKSSQ